MFRPHPSNAEAASRPRAGGSARMRPFRLGRLLGSEKLTAMAKAARSLGKPDAARAVCERTLEKWRSHGIEWSKRKDNA